MSGDYILDNEALWTALGSDYRDIRGDVTEWRQLGSRTDKISHRAHLFKHFLMKVESC